MNKFVSPEVLEKLITGNADASGELSAGLMRRKSGDKPAAELGEAALIAACPMLNATMEEI